MERHFDRQRRFEDILIEVGIRLGERFVVEVLFPWLLTLGTKGIDVPSALEVAREIVTGIENDPDHAAATGEERRAIAAAAIRQMLLNRGGRPSERDVNKLLELALEPGTIPDRGGG